LGRNRYIELEIRKPKTNGAGSKLAAYHKPCEKMAEAVVMDGGRRGELVKVCADPSCRVHHPDTPSPERVAKERADERKRIEKNKQIITTRHYVLAKVLERVSAPLKKADLLTLALYTVWNLSYNQVPALAKRHKVETAKTTKSPQEVLMKKVSAYDDAELSRLLLEISLLDSAYQRGPVSQDLLMDAAKRYRVDVEKIEKAVAAEFAAKKDGKKKPKDKSKAKAAPRA
jgi:ParB family transcriptional regulator, chromosome partitioning protein